MRRYLTDRLTALGTTGPQRFLQTIKEMLGPPYVASQCA